MPGSTEGRSPSRCWTGCRPPWPPACTAWASVAEPADRPEARAFIDGFKKRFGVVPLSEAANSYAAVKFVAAAALLVIATGSSSGLLLGVILLAKPMERNDLFNLSNVLIPAGVGLVALVALLVSGSLQDLFLPLLDKLANPLDYASGVNRLLRPLPYVIQVLNEAPFFGMGFNYFEERVLNNAAGASLFLAVFWELGLVGVGFYLYMLIRLGVSQSPPLTSLALAATCLVTVGLPYSTMQATAIVLMLFTAKAVRRREDQPRRPEAAEQP